MIPRRLDKFLRDSTTLTVEGVREALAAERVQLDGVRVVEPSRLVFADDVITLDGRALTPRAEHAHFMLNKPLGVTSTARDPDGRTDLGAYLARMPAGVFPIGRLDRMTSGLLLFTTDGDLAHAVLHPEHHTHKLYWLWLDEHVTDDDPRLAKLTEGLLLRGESVRAKRVELYHRSEQHTELHVTLTEGKNRQLRRMARALDFYLRALHRKAVGPLQLDGLPLGELRELTASEVADLWCATGGREQAEARKVAALARLAEACRAQGAPQVRLERWLANALQPASKSGTLASCG